MESSLNRTDEIRLPNATELLDFSIEQAPARQEPKVTADNVQSKGTDQMMGILGRGLAMVDNNQIPDTSHQQTKLGEPNYSQVLHMTSPPVEEVE